LESQWYGERWEKADCCGGWSGESVNGFEDALSWGCGRGEGCVECGWEVGLFGDGEFILYIIYFDPAPFFFFGGHLMDSMRMKAFID